MALQFAVKYLPPPYDAWGVCVSNPKTREGRIPIYFCCNGNSDKAKELALKSMKKLEAEYQPFLTLE